MKYDNIYIDNIAYEMAPVVVGSEDIEERLAPIYSALRMSFGQLEALTGIAERRWWPVGYRLSDGAIAAAQKALARSNVTAKDLGALLYTGVCREGLEPATACRVAAAVGVPEDCTVLDLSNACLGVLNGILDVANRIALGQIRAGMVVSCESAREIVEQTLNRVLKTGALGDFNNALATFTGGSGAVAVLLTDGSFDHGPLKRQVLGGVTRTAPEHHELCRWYMEPQGDGVYHEVMYTEAVTVMNKGIVLGASTWKALLAEMDWRPETVDRVICHQVGTTNKEYILAATGIPHEKDFTTFTFLGNMGTVSLPMTAAIAEERGFLQAGQQVAYMGIGSGLNCTMLAVRY